MVAAFNNPAHFKEWIEGLQSFEIIKGEFGKEGTVSKFHFKMDKREITMLETVLTADLPQVYKVKYEANRVLNYVSNHMETAGEGQTLYITEHEFLFNGLMKLIAWLMPSAFNKHSKKFLEDFKKFVEIQND